MKGYILILLLLLPIAYSYDIEITLNSNNIVVEHFKIQKPIGYDSFEFIFTEKPISIIYSGEYLVEDQKIVFLDNGKDIIEFELLFDDLVESSGVKRTFRESFDGANNIKITLPEKFILSSEPSTIPEYDTIKTDGQKISLAWKDETSVAVFYEGGINYIPYILVLFFLFALISIFAFIYIKKQRHKTINEMISEDEKLVLSQLKSGVTKQKDLSKNLGFSKSKMSKVIRKLELKNLIDKKPHFKTNILRIK